MADNTPCYDRRSHVTELRTVIDNGDEVHYVFCRRCGLVGRLQADAIGALRSWDLVSREGRNHHHQVEEEKRDLEDRSA